ncbi:hypothetical protein K457DRAFT_20825 [Linnemannia elongata AG-77]|uniref:Uncharacterized protein n=1 Tax=Linnemannia elongata AG-77 TaxID=1314771 RepID=A0A197JRK2_9FUNG|nr:hypothetical protein K457DRAFT_20825 [Linnemannia elongata AG-77]
MTGADVTVSFVGTPTSTAAESLNLAFGALNIQTQMPGLPTKLLAGASLVVLDTTLVDGLAQAVVTVNNPFTPPMTILSIDSKITFNGVALGSVVSTFGTPSVIPGVGAGTITAPLLMNTNPHDLVTLIRAQAVTNGLNTAVLDGLIALQAGGNPSPALLVGFNIADFVTKAMTGLVVDITMTTTVKVGDYQVTMPYTQTDVTTGTGQTILKLISVLGNLYFVDTTVVGDARISESIFVSDPSYFGISTATSFEFTYVMFLPDFSFTVKATQSLPITFTMKLRTKILNACACASGSFNKAYVNWNPKVALTTMNGVLYPDFVTASASPETGYMTLKVGSDFHSQRLVL